MIIININYILRHLETDQALPRPKTNFVKRSFRYSGAVLWNNLSYEAEQHNRFPILTELLPISVHHWPPPPPPSPPHPLDKLIGREILNQIKSTHYFTTLATSKHTQQKLITRWGVGKHTLQTNRSSVVFTKVTKFERIINYVKMYTI